MNERYLFRGKRKDNGEWAYGGLDTDWGLKPEERDRYWIIQAYLGETLVIPETVGQCSGLRDKNGKFIFEGDITKHRSNYSDNAVIAVVTYTDCHFLALVDEHSGFELSDKLEVVGNKWDNPELLEVE